MAFYASGIAVPDSTRLHAAGVYSCCWYEERESKWKLFLAFGFIPVFFVDEIMKSTWIFSWMVNTISHQNVNPRRLSSWSTGSCCPGLTTGEDFPLGHRKYGEMNHERSSTCPTANGGFLSHGGTQKWMVYNENPIKMDGWGVPLFQETSK